MRLSLHPLFIAVLAAAFLCGFGMVAVALVGAVLVHEFSHAIVAAHFGVRADRLRLLPFGAEITIDCAFMPVDKKVLILLAGSIGNIILAVVLSSILWLFPQFFLVLEVLVVANAVPGVLNLLPIYPLDGGKILFLVSGKRKKWVIWLSNVFFGVLLLASCIFFFNIALVIMCAAMIVNINFELKATNYALYIKTLDKFCADLEKQKKRQ